MWWAKREKCFARVTPVILMVSLTANVFLITRDHVVWVNKTGDFRLVISAETLDDIYQAPCTGESCLSSSVFCSDSVPLPIDLPLPDTPTDLKDWTFRHKRVCPFFSLKRSSEWRRKVSLDCSNQPKIVVSRTNRSSDIYSVNLGDSCLNKVLDNCCKGDKKVPNVVHYIWYSERKLGYFNFLSFMSALRFVRPCLFVLHGDSIPYGPYWDYFISVMPNVIQVNRTRPTEVFGQKLAFTEHASDIMRIEALKAHGGIYLDFDEIVLRPLDPLRTYEYTQGHEIKTTLGSQLIMAQRNATFLHHWHQTYKTDYRKSWGHNALQVPNKLAKTYPHLIHVEGYNFTRPNWQNVNKIFHENYNWSENYGMHLYVRWYSNHTDVNTIRHLNTTIGAVSRHILLGNKELCSN